MSILGKIKSFVLKPVNWIFLGLGLVALINLGVDLPLESKIVWGIVGIGAIWLLLQRLGILPKKQI